MSSNQADVAANDKGKRIRADHILMAVVAICVLVILAVGFGGRQTAGEGDPAGDFLLKVYGGGETQLADYEGQILVLNFWASWCTPCRKELPALQAVWSEYQGRGVAFLGVNVRDVAERAQLLMDEFGLTYPNAYDPQSRIWQSYGLTGLPETVFVTPDGVIAKRFIGEISERALKARLDSLLTAEQKGSE